MKHQQQAFQANFLPPLFSTGETYRYSQHTIRAGILGDLNNARNTPKRTQLICTRCVHSKQQGSISLSCTLVWVRKHIVTPARFKSSKKVTVFPTLGETAFRIVLGTSRGLPATCHDFHLQQCVHPAQPVYAPPLGWWINGVRSPGMFALA